MVGVSPAGRRFEGDAAAVTVVPPGHDAHRPTPILGLAGGREDVTGAFRGKAIRVPST